MNILCIFYACRYLPIFSPILLIRCFLDPRQYFADTDIISTDSNSQREQQQLIFWLSRFLGWTQGVLQQNLHWVEREKHTQQRENFSQGMSRFRDLVFLVADSQQLWADLLTPERSASIKSISGATGKREIFKFIFPSFLSFTDFATLQGLSYKKWCWFLLKVFLLFGRLLSPPSAISTLFSHLMSSWESISKRRPEWSPEGEFHIMKKENLLHFQPMTRERKVIKRNMLSNQIKEF